MSDDLAGDMRQDLDGAREAYTMYTVAMANWYEAVAAQHWTIAEQLHRRVLDTLEAYMTHIEAAQKRIEMARDGR